jgi:hypothetical protein
LRHSVACYKFALFFQGKPLQSLTYTCWAAVRDPHQMDDVGSIQADA